MGDRIRIRMVREIRQDVSDFGRSHTVTFPVGLELNASTVTKVGNAIVGLAADEPIVLPTGSFEIVDVDDPSDHRAMTTVPDGRGGDNPAKVFAECVRCEWSFASDDAASVVRAAKGHRAAERQSAEVKRVVVKVSNDYSRIEGVEFR
jgi:hypothetical protein